MSQKPSVGRIVHFYNTTLEDWQNNYVGKGPYAAIVAQVIPGDIYVNLKVLPYGESWDEGSVSHLDDVQHGQGRYWVWPPRD